MRKLLIATHGEFAGGLLQTIRLVLGQATDVEALNAYTTPDFDMEREVAGWMNQQKDGDELIVLTDVLGGSVANAFSETVFKDGVHVLTGVNAPMLITLVTMLESGIGTEELIEQALQAARDGCVYLNPLMKQNMMDEEDF